MNVFHFFLFRSFRSPLGQDTKAISVGVCVRVSSYQMAFDVHGPITKRSTRTKRNARTRGDCHLCQHVHGAQRRCAAAYRSFSHLKRF